MVSYEELPRQIIEQWIPLQVYVKEEAQIGQKRKCDASGGLSESKRLEISMTSSAVKTPAERSLPSLSSGKSTKTPAGKSLSSASSSKSTKTLTPECSTKRDQTPSGKSLYSASSASKDLAKHFLSSKQCHQEYSQASYIFCSGYF